MRRLGVKAQSGFTLIEVMIVVAILGILAAIAIPSYMDSTKKSRRADAQSALQGLGQAMERFYTENGTYKGASVGGADTGVPDIFAIKSPIDGSQTYYNLKIHSASATAYVIAAEPVGAQAGNGILILKSTGVRGWDRDNDAGGVVGGLGASPNEVEATDMCWEVSC